MRRRHGWGRGAAAATLHGCGTQHLTLACLQAGEPDERLQAADERDDAGHTVAPLQGLEGASIGPFDELVDSGLAALLGVGHAARHGVLRDAEEGTIDGQRVVDVRFEGYGLSNCTRLIQSLPVAPAGPLVRARSWWPYGGGQRCR